MATTTSSAVSTSYTQVNVNADIRSSKPYRGRDYQIDFGPTPDIPLQNYQHVLTETDVVPVEETENPPRNINGPLWFIVVAGLVFANLLTSMDNTIVADIQAPIILSLHSFKNFAWISVGFELGAASVQLFW